LRMLRNSQPFLSPSIPAASIQLSRDYDGRDLVALAALLVQPQPPALLIFEIIADVQSIGRTHARAKHYQPNQGSPHETDYRVR
jgi:hypothetical protein